MNLVWRRRLIWFTILLLIIAALFYGFRPQPRLVEIAKAARGPMQLSVEEEGKTRIISAPKILTLDGKLATIKQGIEIAYEERDRI